MRWSATPNITRSAARFFVCGTPLATDVGSETLVKGNGMAEAKKAARRIRL